MPSLTERQSEILSFLAEHSAAKGYPPTVREIGEHFGIVVNGARNHLDALEKKGYIARDRFTARGLRILARPAPAVEVIPLAAA